MGRSCVCLRNSYSYSSNFTQSFHDFILPFTCVAVFSRIWKWFFAVLYIRNRWYRLYTWWATWSSCVPISVEIFRSTINNIVSSSVHVPCARVLLLLLAYFAAETFVLYFFRLSLPVLFVAALGRCRAPFGFWQPRQLHSSEQGWLLIRHLHRLSRFSIWAQLATGLFLGVHPQEHFCFTFSCGSLLLQYPLQWHLESHCALFFMHLQLDVPHPLLPGVLRQRHPEFSEV